jgi:hypothetical protein
MRCSYCQRGGKKQKVFQRQFSSGKLSLPMCKKCYGSFDSGEKLSAHRQDAERAGLPPVERNPLKLREKLRGLTQEG